MSLLCRLAWGETAETESRSETTWGATIFDRTWILVSLGTAYWKTLPCHSKGFVSEIITYQPILGQPFQDPSPRCDTRGARSRVCSILLNVQHEIRTATRAQTDS